MVMIQAGSPLGNFIEASELATGWVLERSGVWSNVGAGSMCDLTSLTTRKAFKLVLKVVAGGTLGVSIKFNNIGTGVYDYTYNSGTTPTLAINQTVFAISNLVNGEESLIVLEFGGSGANGVNVNFSSLGGGISGGTVYNWLGGSFDGSAVISRIEVSNDADCSGQYALYYNKDIEDAT